MVVLLERSIITDVINGLTQEVILLDIEGFEDFLVALAWRFLAPSA